MTHLSKKIFIGDRFNSDTGEPLQEIPSIKTYAEIQPATYAELKERFPDGAIHSGVIDHVFYYRRCYKHTKRNHGSTYVDKTITSTTHSYFWVGLKDHEGNMHHFSIDAEDEVFTNLKKGDIFTVICFQGVYLNHAIEGKEAQNIVTNNLMNCAAITYKNNKRVSYINPHYVPEMSGAAPVALIVSVLAFITGWILEEFLIGIACGAVAGLIAYPLDLFNNRRQFEKSEETFGAIKSIMAKLRRVSKRDLGYEYLSRLKHRSDVICGECDSRISASLFYCVYCGANQAPSDEEGTNNSYPPPSLIGLKINESNDNELVIPDCNSCSEIKNESENEHSSSTRTSEPEKSTSDANSISAIEDSLLREFTLNYQKEYIHKAALYFNTRNTVHITCIMAKVLDRHNEVEVSNQSTFENNSYFVDVYRNYSDGSSRYDRTELRGSLTTTNSRSSTMKTLFVLQLEGGKVIHTHLPDDMSADLNVDDWFVLAESTVDFDEPLSNREFAINLTKGKEYSSSSFVKYSGPLAFQLWLYLFVFVSVLNFKYQEPIGYWMQNKLIGTGLRELTSTYHIDTYFPIALFILTGIFLLLRTIRLRMENRRNRKKVMAPLRELINSLKEKAQEVEATIKRIS
ncbi:hypothetical protein [Alteromonas sp. S167]|uniref:hypothetical protein n=1 Tax=Alteromonas sp. S167 TaxID=3117402 RepID=UPI002FE0029C